MTSPRVTQYLSEHWRFLTTEGQMGGVDVLRAIAVTAVFFFHFNLFNPGWFGVDLFFVLSGFLIGGAIIKQAESGGWSYGKFYLHRTMRILPLYYAFILLKAAFIGFPLAQDPTSWKSLSSILASLTFMQTTASWYWGWQGDGNFVPGGTWSLVIEEYFYLLCPLFLVNLWKGFRSKNVMISAIAVMCCTGPIVRYIANFGYPPDDIFWYFASWLQFRSRYDTLAFGVLAAAVLTIWKPGPTARRVLFALGIAILGAVVVYLYNSRMWLHSGQTTRGAALWFPFLLGASFAMIILAAYNCRCGSKAIVIVARLSFAIYLGHIFLREMYGAYATSDNFVISWLRNQVASVSVTVFAAGTMAISYALSLLVEYPFIRMYRKPVQSNLWVARGQSMGAQA